MNNEVIGRKKKIFTFAVALFGALVLWMYAIGYDTEISTETYNGIVVEIMGVNTNGYTVADGDSFSLSVDVHLAGTRQILSEIDVSDLSAYVDISGVSGPGLTTLPVTVVVPNGATVETVSVPNVTLYVDVFTSRTIKVNLEKTYTSPYTIGAIAQDTNFVTVYGPESIIQNAEAYVHFDLGAINVGSFNVSGSILLRDAETKVQISNPYVSLSKNIVNVAITMYHQKNVPVKLKVPDVGYAPEDLVFTSNFDSVLLQGPVDALAQIEFLAVSVGDEGDGKSFSRTMTISELLSENGVPSSVNAVLAEAELTYTVSLPTVRFLNVEIPANRIIIYDLPEDGSVFAEALQGITVQILGTYQDIEAYNSALMTVMVGYHTIKKDPATGGYIGYATVSSGDNHICVVGNAYYVPVSLTLQVIESVLSQ